MAPPAPPIPPSPPNRIACLLVPDLVLAAELRAHPEWAGRPLAIAAAAGPRAEIVAVSPEAARHGVRPRTPVVHGHAACAGLTVRVASSALECAARDALLDAALSTSPRAEPAPHASGPYAVEAAVFVDARGVGPLFGGERGFAGALVERAARLGLPGVVALASSPGVARIAARRLVGAREPGTNPPGGAHAIPPGGNETTLVIPPGGGETTHAIPPGGNETTLVIPPGGDAAFLAPLPLDLLNPDDDLAGTLARFGLRRVGDLTRLPERALVARLGRPVRELLALARGESPAPPPAAPERDGFEEAVELEVAVEHLEPVLFVLRGMLARLAARLDCRGLAFADLELRLGLTEGAGDARRVGVAAPTLDVPVALRLLALSLESRPPSRAIETVHLSTPGRPLRGDQLDFFRPAGPTPAVLSRTLAELAALCGSDRVGAPVVADLHRPDAYAVGDFRPPNRDPEPRPTSAEAVLGLRALRPPVAAQVRAPRGAPEWVCSALANGDVVGCAGPWRTTGHWWSEDERYAFDHYDVQTSDGLVVRLRYDWITRRWQIDGLYD